MTGTGETDLFVTTNERPAVGVKVTTTTSTVDVNKLIEKSPEKVANLEKVSAAPIKNDVDLKNAESQALSEFAEPPKFIPEPDSSIDKFVSSAAGIAPDPDSISGLADSSIEGTTDAFSYLQDKLSIGQETADLCKKFKLDSCPAYLDFLNFKTELNLKEYLLVFDGLADKVMNFGGGLDLFGMLGDCPEYLLKTASSKIGKLSGQASKLGNMKAIQKISDQTGSNKISGLQDKLKDLAGTMDSSQNNLDSFNSVLDGAGIPKASLVSKSPEGMDNGTVAYNTSDIVKMTKNGNGPLSDIISEDTLEMAKQINLVTEEANTASDPKNVKSPVPQTTEERLAYQQNRDAPKVKAPSVQVTDVVDYSVNIGKPDEKTKIAPSTYRIKFYKPDGRPSVYFLDELTGKEHLSLSELNRNRARDGYST